MARRRLRSRLRVLAGGALRCWGGNTYGQGATARRGPNRSVAVAVPIEAGRRAVAAGMTHTCALLDDTTIRCWGGNAFGQLGDGTMTDRHPPVSTLPLPGPAVSVAAGGEQAHIGDGNGNDPGLPRG
jgi:Regulator of chromosome condensation (RCC1) repeat